MPTLKCTLGILEQQQWVSCLGEQFGISDTTNTHYCGVVWWTLVCISDTLAPDCSRLLQGPLVWSSPQLLQPLGQLACS